MANPARSLEIGQIYSTFQIALSLHQNPASCPLQFVAKCGYYSHTLGQNRMEVSYRATVPIAVFLVLGITACPVRASSPDSSPADQQSIDALEARASQAQPREQCFLYALFVQQMTELSIRQYEAGDMVRATGLLRRISTSRKRSTSPWPIKTSASRMLSSCLTAPPSASTKCCKPAALQTGPLSRRL